MTNDTQSARIQAPRDPVTGGLTNTLSVDEILDEYGRRKEFSWTGRPGRYYFSGTMQCFRKAWYKAKNGQAALTAKEARVQIERAIWDAFENETIVDDEIVQLRTAADVKVPYPEPPGSEFDTGNAEAGNAVEQHLITLMRSIYGEEGVVLKDIRFSRRITVAVCACGHGPAAHQQVRKVDAGQPAPEGNARGACRRSCSCEAYEEGEVAIIGRTDPLIIGDNFQPLDFFEVKSQLFFARKCKDAVDRYGKEIPFSLVGIEAPDHPTGVANINNAVQLAIGIKVLMDRGLEPPKKRLLYVWRSNYRDHLSLLMSPQDTEFLYDLGLWWVREHHLSLAQEEPPAPQWFMGYECRYCPFKEFCDARNKERDEKPQVHPAMMGLHDRLQEANTQASWENLNPRYVPGPTGEVAA